ncbi:UDP-2,3-diacylglucosamine diphosphatase [Reichenbachiella ulvae]|uniref:UDP-2,3-diacylglucosamine diphosphatase n=1 Tax=Reichenbachiella ulvae TaxID=2980104 RepID=A0ABT3CW63_9BACT|nr:UDP-2,3-diacylglucosamine diphosphatase [Reichenbachiella ulvae]MCV9387705.1 UDP-2,3-diacylglucosamine diphosphatase [Reichenbachiella ulvae]
MDLHIPELQPGKKIYFASDFHLGSPDLVSSIAREKKIVNWLKSITNDAQALVLVGDLFDFWFEYKKSIPKGHIRFLGQLATMADLGIPIIVFVGNHDLWLKDYLKEQLGANIIHHPKSFSLNDKKFYIAHGDGLDPKDKKFRAIKAVFTNPICQYLFRWLHPDIGIALADWWSSKSKDSKLGQHEDQHLVDHSHKLHQNSPHDFYIYGDCHVARTETIEEGLYCNLGDWIHHYSYAEFDGKDLHLKRFQE